MDKKPSEKDGERERIVEEALTTSLPVIGKQIKRARETFSSPSSSSVLQKVQSTKTHTRISQSGT